ncbi:hypothetical protein PR048_013857 [Dryococelus australis]|uniref:Uncharacterized protein n=1 Tax=Dryococelus australis TaxID=614101 RepID=A0ABQ9HTD0_9NEOP|nr:hypothetical protein PR048_013857 [Dryococelus australis]
MCVDVFHVVQSADPDQLCINTVMQTSEATVDEEFRNISQLVDNLTKLRNNWEMNLAEAKLVSKNINIQLLWKTRKHQKRKLFADKSIEINGENPEDVFKHNAYCTLLDIYFPMSVLCCEYFAPFPLLLQRRRDILVS